MAKYTSIAEFKHECPEEKDAMQFVAVSKQGEIHEYWVPVNHWHQEVRTIMTSYVYINEWHMFVQTIHGI